MSQSDVEDTDQPPKLNPNGSDGATTSSQRDDCIRCHSYMFLVSVCHSFEKRIAPNPPNQDIITTGDE